MSIGPLCYKGTHFAFALGVLLPVKVNSQSVAYRKKFKNQNQCKICTSNANSWYSNRAQILSLNMLKSLNYICSTFSSPEGASSHADL